MIDRQRLQRVLHLVSVRSKIECVVALLDQAQRELHSDQLGDRAACRALGEAVQHCRVAKSLLPIELEHLETPG